MNFTSAIRAKPCCKPLVLKFGPQGTVRGVPTSSRSPKRADLLLACAHALRSTAQGVARTVRPHRTTYRARRRINGRLSATIDPSQRREGTWRSSHHARRSPLSPPLATRPPAARVANRRPLRATGTARTVSVRLYRGCLGKAHQVPPFRDDGRHAAVSARSARRSRGGACCRLSGPAPAFVGVGVCASSEPSPRLRPRRHRWQEKSNGHLPRVPPPGAVAIVTPHGVTVRHCRRPCRVPHFPCPSPPPL